MSETRVTISIEDGVADVRLARPDKLNALDPAMFAELAGAINRLGTTAGLRAVVLSGEGRGFCAGLDMASMAGGMPGVSIEERTHGAANLFQQVAWGWRVLSVPVIAAMHGVAFGGGLQIALGADIRLVAPDAQLSLMEIQWGICPDMCGTQLLPELVGRDVAKELALTGRRVSGTEAARLGLATREEADPLAAALALAAEIAGHSRNATRAVKRLVDLAGRVPLEEGLAAEQREIGQLIGSPEQAAVVRARLGR